MTKENEMPEYLYVGQTLERTGWTKRYIGDEIKIDGDTEYARKDLTVSADKFAALMAVANDLAECLGAYKARNRSIAYNVAMKSDEALQSFQQFERGEG